MVTIEEIFNISSASAIDKSFVLPISMKNSTNMFITNMPVKNIEKNLNKYDTVNQIYRLFIATSRFFMEEVYYSVVEIGYDFKQSLLLNTMS